MTSCHKRFTSFRILSGGTLKERYLAFVNFNQNSNPCDNIQLDILTWLTQEFINAKVGNNKKNELDSHSELHLPILNQVIPLRLYFKNGSLTSIIDWRPWSFLSVEDFLNFFKLNVVTYLKDGNFKLLIASKLRLPKKCFLMKFAVSSSWLFSLTFFFCLQFELSKNHNEILWTGSISSAVCYNWCTT